MSNQSIRERYTLLVSIEKQFYRLQTGKNYAKKMQSVLLMVIFIYIFLTEVYDYHTDKLFIVVLNIFFYSRHIDSIGALR